MCTVAAVSDLSRLPGVEGFSKFSPQDIFEKTVSSTKIIPKGPEFYTKNYARDILCEHLKSVLHAFSVFKKDVIVETYHSSCVEKDFSYPYHSESMFLGHVERRIQETLRFFVAPSDIFEGQSPVQTMVNAVLLLCPPVQKHVGVAYVDAAKDYLSWMACYAFMQHVADPSKYVSHDFQHALMVYKRIFQITDVYPESIEYVQKKYLVSKEQALFVLGALCLWHDIGYPYVGHLNKPNHALKGGKDVQKNIKKVFQNLLHVPSMRFEYLWKDLVEALKCHCADHKDAVFPVKIVTSDSSVLTQPEHLKDVVDSLMHGTHKDALWGEFLHEIRCDASCDCAAIRKTLAEASRAVEGGLCIDVTQVADAGWEGRVLDLHRLKDGKIAIPSHDLELSSSPFGLLRLADNLDVTQHRLSETQKHPAYMMTVKILGDAAVVSRWMRVFEDHARTTDVVAEERVKVLWLQACQDVAQSSDVRAPLFLSFLADCPDTPHTWPQARMAWHKAAVDTAVVLSGAHSKEEQYDAYMSVAGLHSGDLSHKGGVSVLKNLTLFRESPERIALLFEKDPLKAEEYATPTADGVDVSTFHQRRALEAFSHVQTDVLWDIRVV